MALSDPLLHPDCFERGHDFIKLGEVDDEELLHGLIAEAEAASRSISSDPPSRESIYFAEVLRRMGFCV